jgi:hypothetical protein
MSLPESGSDTRRYTTKHGTTATMNTANIGGKEISKIRQFHESGELDGLMIRMTEEARQRVERNGIDPVFFTKRWLEKTGFPVGIILDHELAEAEFWRRTRSRTAW